MVSKESRTKVRLNKHRKIRNRFAGTAERPRLAVLRRLMMLQPLQPLVQPSLKRL